MRLPRLRFSMGRMMATVAVIALALVNAELITLLLIFIGSVVAIWSLLAAPTDDPPHRWAIPYFVTLTCLYLPFAWLIGGDSWDSHRWIWIKHWPILPRLLAPGRRSTWG